MIHCDVSVNSISRRRENGGDAVESLNESGKKNIKRSGFVEGEVSCSVGCSARFDLVFCLNT